MDNDEIRALLRELKERSDKSDAVKTAVRIPADAAKVSGRRGKSKEAEAGKGSEQDETEKEESVKRDPEKPETVKRRSARKRAFGKGFGEKTGAETDTAEEITAREKPAKEESAKKKPAKEKPAKKESASEESAKEKPAKEDPVKEKPAKEKTVKKKQIKNTPKERQPVLPIIKGKAAVWRASLRSKGIRGRELGLIAAGLVLLVFIFFLVQSLLFAKNKSANVTADEGLSITVEQEPEEWCTEGDVVLRIRASEPMKALSVNGTPFEIGEGSRVNIMLKADTHILDVRVTCESGERSAQVILPKVDPDLPVLNVGVEGGIVSMEATDDISGVEGIYYGIADKWKDIPVYQKYERPFEWKEDTVYYFYVQDNAGNRTVPRSSTLERSKSLVLKQDHFFLFPEQSASLNVTAEPEGSYIEHLTFSSDSDAVTVSEDGMITGVHEGRAKVTVRAEGVKDVVCQVEVRDEVSITVSALGDITLGTDQNLSSSNSLPTYQQMYGNEYFMKNVKDILSKDDLTFANFEGTLTTETQRENKQYAFKGDPSYVEILKDASIDVVTLANNHSADYGEQSLQDTRYYLTEAGIDYVKDDEIIVKEVNGIRVGLIGIYELNYDADLNDRVIRTIDHAKEEGAQLIIVAFHWGTEKAEQPDNTQISLAHLAIDSGADLVIGHHPHVLEGIEVYKGKHIAYSIGNFCFGGNSSPSDMDSIIYQEIFTFDRSGSVKESRLHIIPIRISSEEWSNNYQPTPAEGAEAERILEKLSQRSEGLSSETA